MTGLFILIIVLTAIVTIMDFINKKNNNDSKSEDEFIDAETYNGKISMDNLVLNFEETSKQEDPVVVYEQEQKDSNQTITEIKYVEDDEELEKTKAKIELQNLKEELIKAELEKESNAPVYIGDTEENIDTIETKLEEVKPVQQENVDFTKNKLDEFEQAQEENAIISLEQFNKISDKIYDNNEISQNQYKDEGNEPISIQELERLYNTKELKVITEPVQSEQLVEPIKAVEVINLSGEKISLHDKFIQTDTKFKNSPIISPVFGIDVQEKINAIELENTANLGKLDEEIRKTNEFLSALRELRKNLEP